jgi:hypothetical protein
MAIMGPALDRERAKGKAQALIRCHCPNRLSTRFKQFGFLRTVYGS